MRKVVVTGSSGVVGSHIVEELIRHGYEVVAVDQVRPKQPVCQYAIVNSMNLGEVYGALAGADAVIHMAAISSPEEHTGEVVFRNNVVSTYNVLEAAAGLGIRKAVIASSICAYGMLYSPEPFDPLYAPLDEDHPLLPRDPYGLSKAIDETTARSFHLKTGMQVVSMRFTSVITADMYADFQPIRQRTLNKGILWGYVDSRDAAAACRLAIEADGLGAMALNIADDCTVSDRTSLELMRTHYPDVSDIRLSGGDPFQTLVSNDKAKTYLRWLPAYHWRQQTGQQIAERGERDENHEN